MYWGADQGEDGSIAVCPALLLPVRNRALGPVKRKRDTGASPGHLMEWNLTTRPSASSTPRMVPLLSWPALEAGPEAASLLPSPVLRPTITPVKTARRATRFAQLPLVLRDMVCRPSSSLTDTTRARAVRVAFGSVAVHLGVVEDDDIESLIRTAAIFDPLLLGEEEMTIWLHKACKNLSFAQNWREAKSKNRGVFE